MNRLSPAQRAQVIAALVEGNSIRATCRMTGVAKGTVLKLLEDIGVVCAAYQDHVLVDLPCTKVQADEIWSFVGSKQKNVPKEKVGEYGDIWTWVAIDGPTKLCVYLTLGTRDVDTAYDFMNDVGKRLANQVQLTTDGRRPYLYAVGEAVEGKVDYAQLIKLYGESADAEKRYSPAECTGTKRKDITGKKAESLAYAIALHFQYYNFARPHMSLKGQTPAMAAGVEDHVWSIEEIVGLLEGAEARRANLKNSR